MKRLAVLIFLALVACGYGQGPNDLNEGSLLTSGSSSGAFTLSWYGQPGRTYFLMQTDDLVTTPWTFVPLIESGSDQAISWGFTSSTPRFFLKLKYTDVPTGDPFNEDFDGDGVSNWNEIQQGTDPLSAALDVNGLPFDWEKFYGITYGTDASLAAPRGDGISYYDAFLSRLNPNDYYDGATPTLATVSGNGQTGNPGDFVAYPLLVSVSGSDNQVMAGAPVIFSVTDGGGVLQASRSTVSGSTITVLTDLNGQAKMFFQLPNLSGTTCHITATAGKGAHQVQVVFQEYSDDGSGDFAVAASNVVATVNPDGSVDVSWTSNTDPDDPSSTELQYKDRDGNWQTFQVVEPGVISYHVPAP